MELTKDHFDILPLASIAIGTTNPRKSFPEKTLNELADSIRKVGVQIPIIVTDNLEGDPEESPAWILVAGERSYRASILAGVETIPAIIRKMTPEQAYETQLLENLSREDLDPFDEAEAYQSLIDNKSWTMQDLMAKIGKSERYIYDRLKLNQISTKVLQAIRDHPELIPIRNLFSRLLHEDQAERDAALLAKEQAAKQKAEEKASKKTARAKKDVPTEETGESNPPTETPSEGQENPKPSRKRQKKQATEGDAS